MYYLKILVSKQYNRISHIRIKLLGYWTSQSKLSNGVNFILSVIVLTDPTLSDYIGKSIHTKYIKVKKLLNLIS